MADKEKKTGVLGTVVFVILLAAVVIGVYLTLNRNDDNGKLEADVEISEVNTLMSRDLTTDYPATAREVMKLYCRITQCLYSEELEDDEIAALVDQIRALYADDLLAENDRDTMLGLARGEIKHYRSNNMVINSYNVAESAEIVYYRTSKPYRAVINIYFTVKQDTAFTRAYEEFVLVEGDDGRWKILGWRQTEE